MLGVIQEQHADRCRLFQQWKGLDFPIVQDALNQNAIAVVPVLMLIDEHGIVRSRRPNPRTLVADFIDKKFDKPASMAEPIAADFSKEDYWQKRYDKNPDDATNIIGLADTKLVWNRKTKKIKEAIKLYEAAIKKESKPADIHFRLGVAHRMLYESTGQANADLFAKAVSSWETALGMNRNQYIWRRRIQQYGPRLKKPYSFYDWVAQARKEIMARGEKPHPLPVEPNGAELAKRARQMIADANSKNPDPTNKITRVAKNMVTTHVNFVPSHPKPGDVVAVHVGLNISESGNWNHETEAMKLWIEKPDSEIVLSRQLVRDETPYKISESRKSVSLSFEVKIPENATKAVDLSAFALFNMCEKENEQCVFRRKDIAIKIPLSK